MARDYRTLKLEILAETKQFVDDMKKGENQVQSFGDRAEKMGKVAAAAFAAAAAAAAAYAGKLLIEGVKAAIEDEAAQLRLANALKNVTGATNQQIDAVEKQITALSLANGIADDQLRPAYQRLATATGSLTKASDALTLALDISAATGKSVEQVSAALGKAYEGNTASLARLGIGLSAAEIKSLGLEGTMKQLADTFKGAATVQANTLEGQIARLQVAFDETKETVGAALLPAIQRLMDYIVNTLIPMLQKAKQAAVDPIIKAFKDNEEALRDLWTFTKNYLVPIFEGALVGAITSIGKAIAGIINIVGTVVREIKNLVNEAIDAINRVIAAYNRIPALPNAPLVPKLGGTSTGGIGATITLPGNGGTVTIPPPGSGGSTSGSSGGIIGGGNAGGGSTGGGSTGSTSPKSNTQNVNVVPTATIPDWMPTPTGSVANWRAFESGDPRPLTSIPGNFNVAGWRAAESGVTVVVQAPSAIDEEGFKRAVVDALNESANRGTGGGGGLRGTAQVL